MTREEAIKMMKAKLECMTRETSGLWKNCNKKCDECNLCYEQGSFGEQIEWLKMAIKALEQQNELFRIGLLKDCESCKAQSCNLDKIRAEIVEQKEFCVDCDGETDLGIAVEIIDKYKAESEVNE